MTRKQWINSLTDEEAEKIHTTFRQFDKNLFTVPVFHTLDQAKKVHMKYGGTGSLDLYKQAKRTQVRNFLRRNKLTQRDLAVQYGRLAAGLSINLKTKAA